MNVSRIQHLLQQLWWEMQGGSTSRHAITEPSLELSPHTPSTEDTMETVTCFLMFLSILQQFPPAHRMMSHYITNYETLECLGQGGFGQVFHVRSRLDQRHLAIKQILFRSPVPPWAPLEEMQHTHLSILTEILANAKMEDHPHIVKYYGAWIELFTERQHREVDFYLLDDGEWSLETEGAITPIEPSMVITQPIFLEEDPMTWPYCLYISMELVQGSTLRAWLQDHSTREPVVDTAIFAQILEGVRAMHARGIYHGDLSPVNLFVTHPPHGADAEVSAPWIKIGDFGMAAFAEGSSFRPDQVSQGSLYSAPEKTFTEKTDVYSLALLWIELHGRWSTDMERIQTLLAARVGTLQPWMEPIRPMLHEDPKKRWSVWDIPKAMCKSACTAR